MSDKGHVNYRAAGREMLGKYVDQKIDNFIADQVHVYVSMHNPAESAEEIAANIAAFLKAREVAWGVTVGKEYFTQAVLQARQEPPTLQQAVDTVHLHHLSGG